MNESAFIYKIQAELCRAMGNALRQELVHLLRDEAKNVNDLVQLTGQSQATVSRHLAILKNGGVITSQRHGQEVYYQIADPRIVSVCDLMRQVLVEQAAHRAEIMKDTHHGTVG